MDCPTCGLANPTETLKCDCGHDFISNTPTEVPGWAIELAWRQKVAAYWSIYWPAMLVTFFVVIFTTLDYNLKDLNRLGVRLQIMGTTAITFYGLQALLVHRLVRKTYRSFRIAVIRDGQEPARKFTAPEGGSVYLRLLGVQIGYYLAYVLLFQLLGLVVSAEVLQPFLSKLVWLMPLAFGPSAVNYAVHAEYVGFRLQAYGYRYM